MKYTFCFFLCFFSVLNLSSCSTAQSTSTESNQIKVERFDKDLYNTLFNGNSKEELISKYGDFLKAFGVVTIDNSETSGDEYFEILKKYFSNDMLQGIYKDELNILEDITPIEEQLTAANALINEKFKGKQLPRLCMHVSGFKTNTIVMQDLISISADKYLGKDYPAYQQFFENYQRAQMEPRYIVRDYLRAWLMSELPKSNKRKSLLSEIINEGKILYISNQLLPDTNENEMLAYSVNQEEWCKAKEKEIWKTILQNNHLYSTDYLLISKYIEDAPHTSVISDDSPARIGSWLGLQIVKAYMQNTDTTLEQLLQEPDSQIILKASKYNP